ncbi:MAG TPA: VanW family protein [Allosphingosinicella sp.]|nr:VanW family protein [Allosphingosinicella sp.]
MPPAAPVSRPIAEDAVFWAKSRLLMLRRMARDAMAAEVRPARRLAGLPAGTFLLALDERPLYTLTEPRERDLELGKVQNLRVAAAAIDGTVIERGETFSFWRTAGRATRAKGYVIGRELRQGCMIPTIGGGLCQLTNALSRVAHAAGMEIVERHSHSARPDGLFVDGATDATVFWNYIDFRFRPSRTVRVGARLTETDLVVRLDALP